MKYVSAITRKNHIYNYIDESEQMKPHTRVHYVQFPLYEIPGKVVYSGCLELQG